MDDKNVFFIGFILGVVFGAGCIISLLGMGDRVDTVNELTVPEDIYRVQVDDVVFICRTKPTIKENKIKLWNCQELYGDLTVIKNFSSYSVEQIK